MTRPIPPFAQSKAMTEINTSWPRVQFAAAAAALAFPVAGLATLLPAGLLGSAPVGALLAFAIGSAIAYARLKTDYPHGSLGLCNVVTLARAAMAAVLCVPLLDPAFMARSAHTDWILMGVALFALSLDGVDGWLARRSGLSSRFGARFDMEVDSALGLILALLVLQADKAGAWVLLLGTMRYIFVAAGWFLPWLNADLPESMRRKTICVVQIGSLVVLMAPIVTQPLSAVIAAVAAALLVWSFAVDARWLSRHRP